MQVQGRGRGGFRLLLKRLVQHRFIWPAADVVRPGSLLGKAQRHLSAQGTTLACCVDDRRHPIDNNA